MQLPVFLAVKLCILRIGEVLPFSSVDPLMFGCWWTDILRCVRAQVKDLAETLKDIHRAVAKPLLCGLGYLFRLLLGSLIFRPVWTPDCFVSCLQRVY